MSKRIAVVISQGQSQNPAKRGLEEEVVAALVGEPGIDVTIIPHLYDLKPAGTGMLALQGIGGDMIVLSWLYERAARWILDRNGIRGRIGVSLVRREEDEDEELQDDPSDAGKEFVSDRREIPQRHVYCLDLRVYKTARPYVDEVKRIAAESELHRDGRIARRPSDKTETNRPMVLPMIGGIRPSEDGLAERSGTPRGSDSQNQEANRISDQVERRWYPVIDYSRCTNCMECIDFCLFGVYGIDAAETILVEQPDNCRKGCPACSRVCPEKAIIFPQHKTAAIAGGPVDGVALKLDLSKIFGAPKDGKSAFDLAAEERDEQLRLAGRDPGEETGALPKRQVGKTAAPKDDLDVLIDSLDELDL
jgi:NAD-dependent dihydropyrimidine dehydrogenase PreA subunit